MDENVLDAECPEEEGVERKYLQLITSLTGLAALWHDLGKASDWFQEKLNKNLVTGDPLRHEWVSCMLLFAYIKSVGAKTDRDWLEAMVAEKFDEAKIIDSIRSLKPDNFWGEAESFTVYLFVAWLILSHHRLPGSKNLEKDCYRYKDVRVKSVENIGTFFKKVIRPALSYVTKEASNAELEAVLTFSRKTDIFTNAKWKERASKWAKELCCYIGEIETLAEKSNFYETLMLPRCALILGDHYQSSLDGAEKKAGDALVANLRDGKPNQTLVEHLLGVEEVSVRCIGKLPMLVKKLPKAYDIEELEKTQPAKYEWQETAVKEIRAIKKQYDTSKMGCFVVDMASTGCGKTIANAKILYALSGEKSLRCSVLLGLRTLTLQTSDEYRTRLGLEKRDLGTIIGSRAFIELYQMRKSSMGSEGCEDEECSDLSLGIDDIETEYTFSKKNMLMADIITDPGAEKMLSVPVLVSTIDQIIRAQEDTVGAHNIIPLLRILTSDIIIDEIDDYSGDDLVAVGRLIYLCGVLGSRVVISSATIPPEEAEGLAAVYQQGFFSHSQLHGKKSQVLCLFADEFFSRAFVLDTDTETDKKSIFREKYREELRKYITGRVENLREKGSPRRGEIVPVVVKTEKAYFVAITEEIRRLHSLQKETDPVTGKSVSFGLVRFSNIEQCILFSRFFGSRNGVGDGITVKFITYHAREVMLIRHEQEKYLDRILSRKTPDDIFYDPAIRSHIDNTENNDIVFVVISSPVEELGRDHDFDWAIIEPASYRSIIQTSGRVLRHREKENTDINIGVMQYNWKALHSNSKDDQCYSKPGFETGHLFLPSHNVTDLIDPVELRNGITAIPRISFCEKEEVKDFISLEHAHTRFLMEEKEEALVQDLSGFCSSGIMLTAISQKIHPFRKDSTAEPKEVFLFNDNGRLVFKAKSNREWIEVGRLNGIEITRDSSDSSDSSGNSDKDWLALTYAKSVETLSRETGLDPLTIQEKYGSLCYSDYSDEWVYSDRYGLEAKKHN